MSTKYPSNSNQAGKTNDTSANSTGGDTPDAMAGQPQRPGQPTGSLSQGDSGVHPPLDGDGERAGQPGASGAIAQTTQPQDATRELNTANGVLPYSVVAERLAVNIARCLDALLDSAPEDIMIAPEWISGIHQRIAGELFPDWAGSFRHTDVQVGTHLPPQGFNVPIHVSNLCLDLAERMRHVSGLESIANLLAWVDWRFQWIQPFKDFNGRVGRILLVALCYKLGLPPINPAADDEPAKAAYFNQGIKNLGYIGLGLVGFVGDGIYEFGFIHRDDSFFYLNDRSVAKLTHHYNPQ